MNDKAGGKPARRSQGVTASGPGRLTVSAMTDCPSRPATHARAGAPSRSPAYEIATSRPAAAEA